MKLCILTCFIVRQLFHHKILPVNTTFRRFVDNFLAFRNMASEIRPGTQQPLRKLARDLKSGNSNDIEVARRLLEVFRMRNVII